MSLTKKTGIIIQARMGSSRLPSKIMMLIAGVPVFKYQLDRISGLNAPVFIATTVKPADDQVVKFAEEQGLPYYRGSEENVLSRYYHCAVEFNLDIIVRLTSDCPFIDADIINEGISQYIAADNDQLYLSNTLNRTYPRGADFEIFSFKMLEDAFNNATELSDMEHVTPYIWKNREDKFKIIQLEQDKNYSDFRLTLDTKEDLELIIKLIEVYAAHKLSMTQICDILDQHPELPLINSHIEQKKT